MFTCLHILPTHSNHLTVMNITFSETARSVREGVGFFELTLLKSEGGVGPVTVTLSTNPESAESETLRVCSIYSILYVLLENLLLNHDLL